MAPYLKSRKGHLSELPINMVHGNCCDSKQNICDLAAHLKGADLLPRIPVKIYKSLAQGTELRLLCHLIAIAAFRDRVQECSYKHTLSRQTENEY